MTTACEAASQPYAAAKSIPIQHGGQVKSFESFARQTLEVVAQKETLQRKPAVEALLEAISHPEEIPGKRWIGIHHKGLVEYLGLPEPNREKPFFSYEEVIPAMPKLEKLVRMAQAKRDKDEKPELIEQKAEALDMSVYIVKNLLSGNALTFIPPAQGETWLSPAETASGARSQELASLFRLYREKRFEEFAAKTKEWNEAVHAATGGRYRKKIEREVLYYNLRPFEKAWLLYLAAFLLLSFRKKNSWLGTAGLLAMAGGAAFHTFGIVLRILILSRPPVSNMYESMVFMDWVLVAAAFVFSAVRRSLTPASATALISALILIYGDLLPIDTSLDILVPVLRSNYWLTIHVLTIVSSYGIFALAMGLGHRHLILWMRGKLNKTEEEKSAQAIYRVMQVGMLLLGIGTVLGGVWANESWGRFWGWDPKETWALITFLGYLVIVHLKLTKVLDAFWLAAGSILGFFFVLMTWYGVNFVLGRGLHSYGFASGGMMWVVYYLIFEVLFLSAVVFKRLSR